jgi:hypothetical protein
MIIGMLLSGLCGRADVLQPEAFRHYVDRFNADDEEHYANAFPNAEAWDFLSENIPLFACPDPDMERTYYFRWWTYRKHLKKTPEGWVVTEFLPDVPWAGRHNTISCPAGHHFYEGRWLRDSRYLADYARFWFREGNPRLYSFWVADAVWAWARVTGEEGLAVELLPDLVANWEAWERSHRPDPEGLFRQIADRDGMEMSLSGDGFRPTINSYQYGDARAVAAIARTAGEPEIAARFDREAERLKQLVQEKLWDPGARFFRTMSRQEGNPLVPVRELAGYVPWYFNLPDAGYEEAWRELTDPEGFAAPFGPTFAERRHPRFQLNYRGHECQWNGPSWPFATSQTLTALANLLNNYEQDVIGKADYFETLKRYANSHTLTREDGTVVPWIDENLHPYTGDWISRTRLKAWGNGTWAKGKGGVERGKDYNHSTFNDLIITGLVGLRPGPGDRLVVNPLLPPDVWDWFCLDRVKVRGQELTILWDRDGTRFNRGAGLRVYVNGSLAARSGRLERLEVDVRPTQSETSR